MIAPQQGQGGSEIGQLRPVHGPFFVSALRFCRLYVQHPGEQLKLTKNRMVGLSIVVTHHHLGKTAIMTVDEGRCDHIAVLRVRIDNCFAMKLLMVLIECSDYRAAGLQCLQHCGRLLTFAGMVQQLSTRVCNSG